MEWNGASYDQTRRPVFATASNGRWLPAAKSTAPNSYVRPQFPTRASSPPNTQTHTGNDSMKPCRRRRRRLVLLPLLLALASATGFIIKPKSRSVSIGSRSTQQQAIGLTAAAADVQDDDAPHYAVLGVSAYKGEVRAAVGAQEQQLPSLYPGAFCKVVPDVLTGSPDHALIMHSDGKPSAPILSTRSRIKSAMCYSPTSHRICPFVSPLHRCGHQGGAGVPLLEGDGRHGRVEGHRSGRAGNEPGRRLLLRRHGPLAHLVDHRAQPPFGARVRE